MTEVTALFWDVGGVVLTNGWDRTARREAAQQFSFDWEDFEDRHELVSAAFETGRLTLEEYLERTIFYRSPPFSRDEFKAFMFAQSRPYQDALVIVDRLARSGRYLMATMNNESLTLNLHRIEQFELRKHFTAFFSSCFLGVRKPEEAIYRLALQITQRAPQECLYIDDRALNLECAERCGIRTIHYQRPAQLEVELRRAGIRE